MRQDTAGEWRYTAGGLLALILWSTTFALARSLSERVGALTAGTAVYLLGGTLCLLHPGWRSGVHRLEGRFSRRYLWGCGGLFVAYTALVYLAVGLARDRQQLLEVALVNYLWPAATVLLSIPLLGKRAGLLVIPGTVVALAGVFLVMTQGMQVTWVTFRENLGGNPAAYLLALLAALAWGFYSNLARRWAKPDRPGAVGWFILATGLVLLAMRLVVAEPGGWDGRAVVEVAALGAVTVVGYPLWEAAMRKGNLLLVASCSYLTPLLSTLVSCVYLQVIPSARLWLGCGLIVAGSVAAWRSIRETSPDDRKTR